MDSTCFVSSTCYSASAIAYSSPSIYTQSEVYTEIRVGRDKSDVKLIATWNQRIDPVKTFFFSSGNDVTTLDNIIDFA
jgi:hypothetical protein